MGGLAGGQWGEMGRTGQERWVLLGADTEHTQVGAADKLTHKGSASQKQRV